MKIFQIALVRENGKECSWIGYARQRLVLEPCVGSSDWTNTERVDFPVFAESGSTTAVSLFVYDQERFVVAAYLTSAVRLDRGTSARFNIGDVTVTGLLVDMMESVRMTWTLPIPTHCKKCNHYNEYVGTEHLVNGDYVCRGCR